MSARLCYLRRADRGDVLAGIRLVGEYTDDSWQAPDNAGGEFGAVEHVRITANASAEWVASALRSAKGARAISTLCLDVDGSACAWVTAPSEQPTVVSAAYAHQSADEGSASLAPAELSTIQPMSSIAAGTGQERRVGLIASPDSVARLVLDELDHRGISVASVSSLWQVLAQAWDPSGPCGDLVHTRLREDRIVATDDPTIAIVMIEPTGRLVWVWSRSGQAFAGGSMRIHSGEIGSTIAPWDVSRLGSDWLAWSAQTGEAPRRVLVVSPELDENASDDALSPARFGTMLGEAWHGATIDMAIEQDPLGETLVRASRIAENTSRSTGLNALTHRPGRAHRSAHRWVAIALLACSGTLAAHAAKQFSEASAIEEQIDPIRGRQREILVASASHQDLASEPVGLALIQLRDQWTARSTNQTTVRDADKPNPVLSELLNIALQLDGASYDDVKPKLIHLHPTKCRVDIWVPRGDLAHDLFDALQDASEGIEWDTPIAAGAAKDLLSPYSITGNFISNPQH